MKKADIIIIGAGPAGLFTAIFCAGRKVIVLEKNTSPGRKLLISGTGRCNITHDSGLSEFFNHYGQNHRFLRTALHGFTNLDLVRFFENNGLKTVTDKNDKVFPATQKSSDVLNVLLDVCYKSKVEIACNQAVLSIIKDGNGFSAETGNGLFTSRLLVITTGGMSYPATGSTGDGYHFAKQFGHTIVPPKPSLSPVFIKRYGFGSISGVSLHNKLVCLYRGNKKISENRGDIGFTHKGLSGPGILDFSRDIVSGDVLKLNFLDAYPDDFRMEMINASEKQGKTAIQTYLKKFDLPRSLVLLILKEIGIEPDTKMAEITKIQRNQLVVALCEYPLLVEKVGGFNMAMVTAGGVKLDEINPKTLESKLVSGLYFAGEVLDIDGDTGGYNLQAAFSMGYLVGEELGVRG